MSVMPLALLAFFLFGALLVLPGALFGEFAAAFQLDLAQSGAVASALMIGIGLGVLAKGPVILGNLPKIPASSRKPPPGVPGLELVSGSSENTSGVPCWIRKIPVT